MLRFSPITGCLLLACGVALVAPGCSRTAHRIRADRDAYRAIWENAIRTHDPVGDYSIEVDPRSRMFNPFDPDREPMPPDDPASHEYMHRVRRMKGWKHWHENGDTPYAENPDWQCFLNLDADGCLLLGSDEALRLARLHSRAYQSQLEDLYLSALDVSFERFRFDAMFFSGHQFQFTADGPDRPGGGGQSSSELLVGTLPAAQEGIRMEKLFATGGELVVGFANAVVWEFSGPNRQSATTLLNFAFVQPLLRNGGKARVLERLTFSERALLANVRQMERYRRGFYLEIFAGEPAGPGPSRRGGVFGGAGLEGFAGVGGGFGRISPGPAGIAVTPGVGALQAGGYLGLLQEQQTIRNLEFNVTGLRTNLERLKAIADAEHPDPGQQLRARLQVEQAEQAFYSAQSRLLNSKLVFQNNIDAFKVNVGLPPDLCLKVQDPILDQFLLIDDEMVSIQHRLTELQQELGRLHVELREAAPGEERRLPWKEELREPLAKLQRGIAEMAALRRTLAARLQQLDNEDCPEIILARRRRFEELRQRYARRRLGSPDPTLSDEGEQRLQAQARELLDVAHLDATLEKFNADRRSLAAEIAQREGVVAVLRHNLEALLSRPDDLTPEQIYDALFGEVDRVDDPATAGILHATDVLSDLAVLALELSLVMAKQRAMCIDVTPVDLEPELAFEVARAHRRDWMNARAALVDAWRLIEFNANDLEAQLNIVFEGDIQNLGDHPLHLRGTTGRLRARAELDTPLTRVAERNNYRQALIEYQQARRNYYAFTDQVNRSLRTTLRAIEINEINFEARRRAVLAAIDQVVTNRLIQDQPAPPGELREVGVTAARDAVSALIDLLNAQNDFLSVWVSFEVLRRVLDRDLGTMQLDPEGNWIDPGKLGARSGFLMPADCDDCRWEAEIFGLPLPGDEAFEIEELPPGEIREELPPGEILPWMGRRGAADEKAPAPSHESPAVSAAARVVFTSEQPSFESAPAPPRARLVETFFGRPETAKR